MDVGGKKVEPTTLSRHLLRLAYRRAYNDKGNLYDNLETEVAHSHSQRETNLDEQREE